MSTIDVPVPEPIAGLAPSREPRRTAQLNGHCLIVHDLSNAPPMSGFKTCSVETYLEGQDDTLAPEVNVINLCRSYEYLSNGYYVSLLADARRQPVLPSLDDIEEASHAYAYLRTLREAGIRTIDFTVMPGRTRLLPEIMIPGFRPGARPGGARPLRLGSKRAPGGARYAAADTPYEDVLSVMGRTRDVRFRKLCAAVFRVLRFPILHFRVFDQDDVWKVGQVAPGRLADLTPEDLELLAAALAAPRTSLPPVVCSSPSRSSIACLWDPQDPFAASDEDALRCFARAAERQKLLFEVIGPREISRLAEHDALFIRTVTGVENVSFRFAQTAESLGMPVIDDPQSILRCSNKVYLYELCRKHGLPTLRSSIVSRKTTPEELRELGFPLVLKVPDGSFSAAVKRADDAEVLATLLRELLRKTPLLVAQEYRPTEFDWRIGILEGRVLYVCKYFMARGHWQIARHYGSGNSRSGRVEAVPLDQAPPEVMRLALESTNLIGNGLYGVDVKETEAGPVLIEINDNPNVERGDEDFAEGERLYDAIIGCFARRIDLASRVSQSPSDAA